MNSFELNKVAGAVLGTLLFAFGTGFLAELIYTPKPAGKAGYALPGGSEGGEHGGAAPAGGGEAAAPKEGIAVLLASADAEKGKAGTKACQACHSFEKGGPNKVGPDLWEVVGRKKGSHEGFGYSEAMKAKGGEWGYEELDGFLTKPSEYVKGTKMSYQGISAAPERANVIAYLRTLAETPKPLPAAEKKDEPKKDEGKKDEAKPEGDKKAEGEAKPDAKPAEPEKKAEGEAKPDGKAAEGEKKAEDAKPAETKPAESKPAESKPAEEAKPAEPEKKAEDAKPAETPPAVDKKPEEATPAKEPAEAKPEGDTKTDDNGGEPKPQ
ncbi:MULTISPECIES: c-type cytochrome [Methylobacterium]|uniref:Cytochrome c domain-containing protein n=1 Tax=Methylobacterium thuringiense TaxID=1003091 RepID=A0ABQ4TUT3_9HYPH|nr:MULTISPECIES: cytochrome c family protein [Methylobacterium]TXN22761.1 c-type cytochrome [Methylobacterium sp. WL9]GJE57645.1 hypothetical protein EKPJFOCH_4163 [Methylobacterium thuringiense]